MSWQQKVVDASLCARLADASVRRPCPRAAPCREQTGCSSIGSALFEEGCMDAHRHLYEPHNRNDGRSLTRCPSTSNSFCLCIITGSVDGCAYFTPALCLQKRSPSAWTRAMACSTRRPCRSRCVCRGLWHSGQARDRCPGPEWGSRGFEHSSMTGVKTRVATREKLSHAGFDPTALGHCQSADSFPERQRLQHCFHMVLREGGCGVDAEGGRRGNNVQS